MKPVKTMDTIKTKNAYMAISMTIAAMLNPMKQLFQISPAFLKRIQDEWWRMHSMELVNFNTMIHQ